MTRKRGYPKVVVLIFQITTGCIVLIAFCTLGIHSLLAQASSMTNSSSKEKETTIPNEDLQKAETMDPKSQIIKQIQKVNNDGSYTVGYEANDGTFKIESRDVLGNVKGTFGYIDINGEIKRVSYTANNGTGLKNVVPNFQDSKENDNRYNKTVLPTRKLFYSSNGSPTSTKSPVIQPIPRKSRLHTSSSSTERPLYDYLSSATQKNFKAESPTTTIVYATSIPSPKPYINIRPTPLPGTNFRGTTEQQITRPDKVEINQVSQVQVSSLIDNYKLKPVTEDVDEKDDNKLVVRSSTLRRQLTPESNPDESYVPGTASGGTRTIFTTTNGPKIPTLLLAARQRAAKIQNSLNNHNVSPNEKYYTENYDAEEPTTEATSENFYHTQSSQIADQIPANRFIQDDPRRLRQRNPQFIRLPNTNYKTKELESEIKQVSENRQYLKENTAVQDDSNKMKQFYEQELANAQTGPFYQNQPQNYYDGYLPHDQAAGYYPQSIPNVFNPHRQNIYNGPDRPLTARDFERLLHLLIYRHQLRQRIANNNYYPGPYDDPYYLGYSNSYTRPPIYNPYDPRTFVRPTHLRPYPQVESMYEAQNPIPNADINTMSYELQRLIPRKKQYNPKYFGIHNPAVYNNPNNYVSNPSIQNSHLQQPIAANSNENYLPPDVREELLYRMLMLALQSESQQISAASTQNPTNSISSINSESDTDSSTTTKQPIIYKKPVRSVQILGEEN